MDATTIAVDVAKSVIEIAIADREWHIIARHRFNRTQFARFLATTSPTHVVMEACGTAHYWGRCAHRYRHTVTLLPPGYVRPYVRRNKTDRTDAAALLEATRSGQIPSVPVKSVAQQTLVALHPIRAQWMTTRTARINALRGILREQGLLLPAGAGPAERAIPAVVEDADAPIADSVRHMISLMHGEIRALDPSSSSDDGPRAGQMAHRSNRPHQAVSTPGSRSRKSDWPRGERMSILARRIKSSTDMDVEVREPGTKHSISLQQVERWLAGATPNPNEAVRKAKLKMMMVKSG